LQLAFRVFVAVGLWLTAIAKLVSGPVPGTLLEAHQAWVFVAISEIVVGLLLVHRRGARLGLWFVLVFAIVAVAFAMSGRPCGCGGYWFNMDERLRISGGCLLGAAACWALSASGSAASHSGPVAARLDAGDSDSVVS
jgi:uncharacterized membrane protein YphA (DoxX/SURF4 family)